jgi:TolA-binding protein
MSSIAGRKFKYIAALVCAVCVSLLLAASVLAAPASSEAKSPEANATVSGQSANSVTGDQKEIEEMKHQLAEQQKQIEELRTMLQKQAKRTEESTATAASQVQGTTSAGSNIGSQVASMVPMLPPASPSMNPSAAAASATPPAAAQAPAAKSEVPSWVKGFKPIGTFYLSYQAGTKDSGTQQTTNYNSFQLKRGYFGADVDVTPYLTSRFVGDITLDSTGDVKVRAKYLYGKFHTKGNDVITGPYMEFGLAHMPWLDFEEAMNGFRMQDTMFLERNSIFNSADMGVLVGSDLGGTMSSDFKSKVNSHYAGRYGSWQVGIYNGGGYHAAENNSNKAFEARLSIRPVPSALPGLQVTAFGVVGKGNKAATGTTPPPDWKSGVAMISYESQYFTFSGQGYLGDGNQGGSALDSTGSAAHQTGFSVFASAHIPIPRHGQKVSILGRMDEFNSNTRIYNDLQRRYIAGFAWHLYKDNICLIDYEHLSHSLSTLAGEDRVQATLQTVF